MNSRGKRLLSVKHATRRDRFPGSFARQSASIVGQPTIKRLAIERIVVIFGIDPRPLLRCSAIGGDTFYRLDRDHDLPYIFPTLHPPPSRCWLGCSLARERAGQNPIREDPGKSETRKGRGRKSERERERERRSKRRLVREERTTTSQGRVSATSHVNIRLCVRYGGVRPVCMETKALPCWTTGVEPLVERPCLPTPWRTTLREGSPTTPFLASSSYRRPSFLSLSLTHTLPLSLSYCPCRFHGATIPIPSRQGSSDYGQRVSTTDQRGFIGGDRAGPARP